MDTKNARTPEPKTFDIDQGKNLCHEVYALCDASEEMREVLPMQATAMERHY